MSEQASEVRGSAEWARRRLAVDPMDATWISTLDAAELLSWVQIVASHRARALGIDHANRADVVHDGLAVILSTVQRSRHRIASADNPAAVLERAAVRAVNAGRHRVRMAGLGGAQPNGRMWRAAYPVPVGGDAARRIFDNLPAAEGYASPEVEQMAGRVSAWVATNLAVELSAGAVDAIVYVLDRLVAGVARASLTRGGHSGLGNDPAMRHLGFTPDDARGFGTWLLGRPDRPSVAPSVLDAVVDGASPEAALADRWRDEALRLRLGIAVPSAT